MRRSAVIRSRTGEDSGGSVAKPAPPVPKKELTEREKKPSEAEEEAAPEVKREALQELHRDAVSGALKRRKMLSIAYQKPAGASSASKPSKAAARVEVKAAAVAANMEVAAVPARYFLCMHTKRSNRKHKVYEDGVITVEGGVVKLFDMEAKMLGKTTSYSAQNMSDLHSGNELVVGPRELEVYTQIDAAQFISGKVFRNATAHTVQTVEKPKKPVKPLKQLDAPKGLEVERDASVSRMPRHDPDAPGAVVLSRRGTVPVVVDPHLAKQLRPHQREGVQFMYDCIMGYRQFEGNGCILADEMGLGKTLQAVTLIWTLLKTGPEGEAVARKVAVVTPTSLVRNWLKEFRRWLGMERIQPCTIDDAKKKTDAVEKLEKFARIPHNKVLVISYESFRIHKELMTKMEFDLLVLDEGHRIKNVTAQISKALSMVRTRRRVLLTGTPLQNDLKEFYAMVDFCNPGILGTPKFFQEFFDKPISLSRDVGTSDVKRQQGQQKFEELSRITAAFMLRRTNRILEDYLPPKTEQVVFCRPSETQVKLYRFFLGSKLLREALTEGTWSSGASLECISILTKLCNYPGLVYSKAVSFLEDQKQDDDVPAAKIISIDKLFPEEVVVDEHGAPIGNVRVDLSGKLTVLDNMLQVLRRTTDDRVVVVSNFTKTLNVIEKLCLERGWKFFRLDGQTEQTKRQQYVDAFNRPNSDAFCFLLSSKAGGTGLNLVGGNRLILFDSDWNPATDRQAMARIWRDGQTKRVFLYRFLMTGSIDEKIFQRQLSKEGLSTSVLDSAMSKAVFSTADLKDIFSFSTYTMCDTHDLICDCWLNRADNGASKQGQSRVNAYDISRWSHLNDVTKVEDSALRAAAIAEPESVTACFSIKTDGSKYAAAEGVKVDDTDLPAIVGAPEEEDDGGINEMGLEIDE